MASNALPEMTLPVELKLRYPNVMKAFLVDTIATVAFFTLIATFSELVIVGMEPAQVLLARAIMVPVMVLTARPYGLWRDLILRRAPKTSPVGYIIVDSIAFLTFQVPVYVGTLLIAGATVNEIALATASATAFMLVVGRPFGVFLDAVRRWAGTAAPQA